jgi:23S rRNA (guanosine2251-2'-O)-methyltransferase
VAEYIEGRRAVTEALRAGAPIKCALIADVPEADAAEAPQQPRRGRQGRPARETGEAAALSKLVDRLRKAGVEVRRVPRSVLDRISEEGHSHGAHQGIVCEVAPYRYADLMDVAVAGARKEQALVLVLDHLTDEGNVGAVMRTAEVVGATGVVIPSKRGAQVSVGVYKTSAGAVFHLPVARVPNLVSALKTLKDAGFWVAGASERAELDIWHAPLAGRVALVVGNEGEGISRLVLEECDFLVSLPQVGQVGSLNVAQATTAVAYEWMRQCRAAAEKGQGR